MSIVKRRPGLSDAARGHLIDQLRDLAGATRSRLRGHARRVALTFNTRCRDRDAIPEGLIPADLLLLLALSYRPYRHHARGRRWGTILASYAPTFDPDAGRVIFRCRHARDLADPLPDERQRLGHAATRAAVALHHAVEDADRIDLADAPHLPEFYYAFDPRRSPAVDAPAEGIAVDGLIAWPAGLFGPGGAALLRVPERVYASLDHLRGRRIRNPAFSVLRRHGVLPARIAYGDWRSGISGLAGGARAYQDPADPGTEAFRLRRSIQDYVLADPAREPRILEDLAEACHAMGLRMLDEPDPTGALAALLDGPWDRPRVPGAAAIQVVELAGPAGSAAMAFADDSGVVDLADLGAEGNRRFAPPSGS